MAQLNNFKKIILATGQINYLASVIETVQLELNSLANSFAKEQMQEKEDLFGTIVNDLSIAVVKLASFTTKHDDMVLPIDCRILTAAIENLTLGMDEEETYEHPENDQL